MSGIVRVSFLQYNHYIQYNINSSDIQEDEVKAWSLYEHSVVTKNDEINGRKQICVL